MIDTVTTSLEDRLKEVRRRFKKASTGKDDNAERIHKLRVATRRASSALDLFAEFLPKKRTTRLERLLKRIRKSAGKVRDYDMLLARFPDDQSPRARIFVDKIQKRRREENRSLAELYDKKKLSRRLKQQSRSLLRKTRKRFQKNKEWAARDLAQWAPNRLCNFVTDFFQAADPDPHDFAQLHAFRIQAKALRYAMELVVPAFPREFKTEAYPIVERLQSLLGDIHDESMFLSRAAKRLSGGVSPQDIEALKRSVAAEQHKLDDLEQEFEHWWTRERRETLNRQFDELVCGR